MALRTITFNSIPSTTAALSIPGGYVQQIRRPLHPGNRARYMEILGRDGAYDFGRDRKSRPIVTRFPFAWNPAGSGGLDEEELFQAASDAIASWLDGDPENDGLSQLILSNYPDRYYMARCDYDITPDDSAPGIAYCEAIFTAPDGCGYASAAITAEDIAEEQTLYLGGAGGGTFILGDGAIWSAPIAFDASAATIEAALEGLYGAGVVTVAAAGPGAGFDFIVNFDLSVGASGLDADFTGLTGATDPALSAVSIYGLAFPAENSGTLKTPVLITATMAAVSATLKVTLDETGEFILLTPEAGDLQIGDIVIIDTNLRTCTINGIDAREDISFTSTWFMLPAGGLVAGVMTPAQFTISALPISTDLEITFRERFI